MSDPHPLIWLAVAGGIAAAAIAVLALWLFADRRFERRAWRDVRGHCEHDLPRFDPAVVADLPEPARRFLEYAIAPGTPLASVVEIEMTGSLNLGTRDAPNTRPMSASQILAPAHGFVWQVRAGALSGSDGAARATSWTRFRLWRLIPVVRVAGSADHHRSAWGRVAAESAFWLPATLLPGPAVSWSAVDDNTARAHVSLGGYAHTIDLSVDADGRAGRIVIQRWSNENADRVFREQPFGGELSDYREVAGFRLPMHVEGGNLIGTPDYFPFFRADVGCVRFPELESRNVRV